MTARHWSMAAAAQLAFAAMPSEGRTRFPSLEAMIDGTRRQLSDQVSSAAEGRQVLHVGYCAHANVGDNAISIAEDSLVRRAQLRTVDRVTTRETSWVGHCREHARSLILLHGGGNIGDIYPEETHNRVAILEQCRNQPVLQMPQSIYFSDLAAAEPFRRASGSHPNFHLYVRDTTSLDWASTYLDCSVSLAPDSVFALGRFKRPIAATVPVLALLRQDVEAATARGDLPEGIPVADWMIEPRARQDVRLLPSRALERPRVADSFVASRLAHWAAHGRTRRGLRLLSQGERIVTDRLHAVILSVLLGLPVTAVDNSYGKVTGFIETWNLDSIANARIAASLGDAVAFSQSASAGPE